MNSKNITNEELVEEFDIVEQTPTVDEFIKELEEKEKSLHISSDMVIEVDDRKSKDIIMHRNKVTSLIENTRKAIHEFRKSIPAEELEEINQSLIKSEQELIEDDIEIIKMVYNEVEGTANKLSEKLMSVA